MPKFGKRDNRKTRLSEGEPYAGKARNADDCRIYVGNLSWEVSGRDLQNVFEQCGRVINAEILMDGPNKSKGCGIVEYSTQSAAQSAIANMQEVDIKGRKVFVREDREPKGSGHSRQFQQKQKAFDTHLPYENPSHFPTQQHIQQPFDSWVNDSYSSAPVIKQPFPQTSQSSGFNDAQSRRVYITNLSWDVDWRMLKDKLKTIGPVVRCDVAMETSGRSRGFGIGEYEHVEDAERAIAELNNTDLAGRPIYIREDREANDDIIGQNRNVRNFGDSSNNGVGTFGSSYLNADAQPRRVYVTNLAWDVDWRMLKDKLKTIGPVVRCDVAMETSGRSRGFGIGEYEYVEDAERAIAELNNTDLAGRPIYIREDREDRS